jgi:chemotaxis-related protein WspB
MLLLVFRVAGNDYGVTAARVVEVVPRVDLRPVPHAPEPLAGLFRYRGRMVPVIDLGILLGSGPCAPLLSTRIILVSEPYAPQSEASVGLIAEHVSEVREVGEHQVLPPPAVAGPNPYLDSIVSGDSGLVPLIAVDRVLAEPMRRALSEAVP